MKRHTIVQDSLKESGSLVGLEIELENGIINQVVFSQNKNVRSSLAAEWETWKLQGGGQALAELKKLIDAAWPQIEAIRQEHQHKDESAKEKIE